MSRSEKVSSPLTVNKNSSFRWVAVVIVLHRDNMAEAEEKHESALCPEMAAYYAARSGAKCVRARQLPRNCLNCHKAVCNL